MHLFIVTGTTRGLGEALAARLLLPGHRVGCLSRRPNVALERRAAELGVPLSYAACDLREAGQAERGLEALLEAADASCESLTLINNAGMLDPMGPLHEADPAELAAHVQVNLLAPLQLTSAFIRLTTPWAGTARRRAVAISSGAGRKPYAGWAAYCAAKAGVDMMTRCVAMEQGDGPGAVKLLSIAPGVVETRMQVQVRGTDESRFPAVGRFVALQASGGVFSAGEAADRIVRIVTADKWAQGDVLDARTYPMEEV